MDQPSTSARNAAPLSDRTAPAASDRSAPAASDRSAPTAAPALGSAGATAPRGDAEPRWLGEEEQRTWLAYVHASTLLEDYLDRQLQRDAGMPHLYYALLVQLSAAPRRRMRMTELARSSKITRSRLSHAIARLERSGWVRREDCPTDKRGQFAILTDGGYEVLQHTAPGHVEAVRQAVFDRLTPAQQKSFGEIMRIVAEGLQPKEAGADLPWLR
ncbi:MarR family winged helix-turn-helix transcriptional regulator [Streptomyces longispororuber]|uniref:MarR family winged helix-turn-helix transcriptional regulator n=1 Tax=Streptomyces longispororuber TaxID=68230 RepID=UPI0036F9423D